jgi:hypothetical protein
MALWHRQVVLIESLELQVRNVLHFAFFLEHKLISLYKNSIIRFVCLGKQTTYIIKHLYN